MSTHCKLYSKIYKHLYAIRLSLNHWFFLPKIKWLNLSLSVWCLLDYIVSSQVVKLQTIQKPKEDTNFKHTYSMCRIFITCMISRIKFDFKIMKYQNTHPKSGKIQYIQCNSPSTYIYITRYYEVFLHKKNHFWGLTFVDKF